MIIGGDEGMAMHIIEWIVYVVWFIGFCLAIRVIWKKYNYNRTHEHTGSESQTMILIYYILLLVIVGGISLFIMLGIGGAVW